MVNRDFSGPRDSGHNTRWPVTGKFQVIVTPRKIIAACSMTGSCRRYIALLSEGSKLLVRSNWTMKVRSPQL